MIQESKILGLKVHLGKEDEILKIIGGFLNSKNRNGYLIITLNPEMVVRAQKDHSFEQIINNADLVIPDGIGIIKAVSFLKRNHLKLSRITGVDLVYHLARLSQDKGRFFLFGAKPSVLRETINNLRKVFPKIKIAGAEDGYSYQDEEVIKKINIKKPNILLVALGSPKQEKWLYRFLKQMPSVKIAVGVGGAFDFISGKIKRAPLQVRNLGAEWFWRFLRQPWRAKRIYKAVVVFPLLVIREQFKRIL